VNAVDFNRIQRFFWVAIPAVSVLWAVRLWLLGLASQYPLLGAFLIGEALLHMSGVFLYHLAGARSQLYVWFWPVSQVISSTLSFLVLLQVFQRLVESYEGFRRLGQIVLYGSLGVASSIVLGSIFLDPNTDLQTLPGFWIVEERSVYFALTAVVLALLGFAVVFRLIPPRNVLILFAVFGLLFVGQALVWALRDFLGWEFRGSRTLVSSALYSVCLLGGTVTFSRLGEREVHSVHPGSASEGNEGKVARRLEEINQTLLNVFRL
jgi:hypothetical protein